MESEMSPGAWWATFGPATDEELNQLDMLAMSFSSSMTTRYCIKHMRTSTNWMC